MADYDSSLPVRTENDGDIAAKISDATIPSQQLKVNVDGSIDVNAQVTNSNLDASTDNVAISDGTDVLAIEADGSINVNTTIAGTVDVSGSTVTIQEPLSIDDNGGSITVDGSVSLLGTSAVSATDLDIRDLTFATDTVNVSGSEVSLDAATLAALESVTVTATDLDIRDLTAASDSVSAHLFDETGAAYSEANPLPVLTVNNPGNKVTDYQTTASVAKDAVVTHSYTVTAGFDFCGQEAWASGSGKIKVEVLVGGAVVFVGFNSTSNPNIRIPLDLAVGAPAGTVVAIRITNRDNQTQDVYSTLTGIEKAI